MFMMYCWHVLLTHNLQHLIRIYKKGFIICLIQKITITALLKAPNILSSSTFTIVSSSLSLHSSIPNKLTTMFPWPEDECIPSLGRASDRPSRQEAQYEWQQTGWAAPILSLKGGGGGRPNRPHEYILAWLWSKCHLHSFHPSLHPHLFWMSCTVVLWFLQ